MADAIATSPQVSGATGTFVQPRADPVLPAAKRARTAASTSTLTSAQRFFGTAELLKIVGHHLFYEKIDLIQLSQVSNFVRAAVLPLLVGTLNVPFTRIGRAFYFFVINPDLVQHVRFLRIWDDVAHLTARWTSNAITRKSKRRPRPASDVYRSLRILLMLFDDPGVRQPPLLELCVGQKDLFNLYGHLNLLPRVVLRLVSLRIEDDFDMSLPRFADDQLQERLVPLVVSEALSLLLNMVFDRQLEATGPARLQSFSFTTFRSVPTIQASILPILGPRLLSRLASSIHTLQLNVANITDIDVPNYLLFLGQLWLKLKSVRIYAGLSELDTNTDTLQHLLRSFILHHPQLSHVYINAVDDPHFVYTEEQANTDLWHSHTLPQLRSCWLQYPRLPSVFLNDFLARHATMEDIMLHPDENPSILAGQPELMRSLRVLRCGAGGLKTSGVKTLLKNGPRIRELHFEINEEFGPEDIMDFHVGSVPSVTFLALNLVKFSTAALLHHLRRILLQVCESLPNLVELAVTLRHGQSSERPDSKDESIRFLSSFLTRCRQTPGCRFRAIRIQYEGAVRLPTEKGLIVAPLDLPAHLEYLVWSIPNLGTMQHFRIVDIHSNTGSITRRLQLLPPSFRPQVDRATGVWEDLDNHQSTLSLLDHTGDTVRPKVL